MFCPECGKTIDDDSRFCEHCGNSIENDIPEEINTQNDKSAPILACPDCGKSIPDDSKFCEHCGKNIDTDFPQKISIKDNEPVPNSIPSTDIHKQPPKVEYTTCRNCGDKIDGSSEYCPICKNIIAMKNKKVTPEQKTIVQSSVQKNNLWKWIAGVIIVLIVEAALFYIIYTHRINQRFYNYYNSGEKYLDLGQYQNAIDAYDKAILLKPRDFISYFQRGVAYHSFGQYQRAIEDYNKAIKLDPKNADIYNNRGYAYHSLGQYQQAIENYNEAIRLEPNLDIVYVRRGNSHAKLNQNDKAREDYDKAISLNPNNSLAYYNYACLFALQNNAAVACEWLQLAIGKKDNYGMNIMKSLQEDKDFDNIRDSECFINLFQ